MNKFKKLVAAVLVSVMAISSTAVAAVSPTPVTATQTAEKESKNGATKKVTFATSENGTATVTKVTGNSKMLYMGNRSKVVDGVKYTVTKLAKDALKGSNIKTLNLKAIKKASEVSFAKGSFNGAKVTKVVVSKKMTKAQVKALQKKLAKVGCKAKIVKK